MFVMRNVLRRRKVRKQGVEYLRHARHVRNMHEDVMTEEARDALQTAIEHLERALRGRGIDDIGDRTEALHSLLLREIPPKRGAWFREHIEVAVVAISVAMALRAYFAQPFKIPTGSMQPTLYGIHVVDEGEPGWMDRIPLKYAKWLATGDWHRRVIVQRSGELSRHYETPFNDPAMVHLYVGGDRYRVPKDAKLRYAPGEFISRGSVLWEGTVRAGDHVFVDKMAWNFRSPRRGGVIVFSTDGIRGLPPKTHYIKRLIGLPGETVSIREPDVCIDGEVLREPETIAHIAARKAPYSTGYTYAEMLASPSHGFKLESRQYFALGDNTTNSRDSRFWGFVPQQNLVGPAFVVYWPFTARWGLLGR
jgi:signal peptidase I